MKWLERLRKRFCFHRWYYVWRKWDTTITNYFGDKVPVVVEKQFRICEKNCGKVQHWRGGQSVGEWVDDDIFLLSAESIELIEIGAIKI